MPKENTHVWFAKRVQNNITDKNIQQRLSANQAAFYLGAVMPDLLFYSYEAPVKSIADRLHGVEGEATLDIVYAWIRYGYEHRDVQLLSFVCGYLTHAALDAVFHPVVIACTGNPYADDEKQAQWATYLHRCWETELDILVNDGNMMFSYTEKTLLQNLPACSLLAQQFGIPLKAVERSCLRAMRVNRLIRTRWGYIFFLLLSQFRIIHPEDVGLCYANVLPDVQLLSDPIVYHDVFTNEEKRTTLEALFLQAETASQEYCTQLFSGMDSRQSEDAVFPKLVERSLETGRNRISVKEMRYVPDAMELMRHFGRK